MQQRDPINLVREGMKVFDANGKEIGSIEEVYIGAVSPVEDELGLGPQQTDAPETIQNDTVVDDLARGMGGDDDLPDVVCKRLQRSGFIRIDAGLLAKDCYATPEQIGAIGEDRIQLNVLRDELVHQ